LSKFYAFANLGFNGYNRQNTKVLLLDSLSQISFNYF